MEVAGGVRKSWALRMFLLDLECLLTGFAMEITSFAS
jgi:hypothetical protein